MNNGNFTERNFGKSSVLRLLGGKQRVVEILKENAPPDWNRYFEPFFGGGSLFLSIPSETALLNDANSLLMDMYESIKKNPSLVHRRLVDLASQHNEEFYYQTRKKFNESRKSSLRAAQFIYLNRACFNGIFRVNRLREFNVPSGKKKAVIIPNLCNLQALSKKLTKTQLMSVDFEKSLSTVSKNDFVYMDPPYMPMDSKSGFSRYTWPMFGRDDFVRLSEVATRLRKSGASVMISNHDIPEVREMFNDWKIVSFPMTRTGLGKRKAGGSDSKVKVVKEVLIKSY